MMVNNFSRQLYWLFYKLLDKVVDCDYITQSCSNIILSDKKNYGLFWSFRQHMRMDPMKIRVEDRIVWFKLIDVKRSYRKLFYDSKNIIPYEDPITDDEIDEPCCKECHKARSFFVYWSIYPTYKIEIFCIHMLETDILDTILN